jgi:hypothetical protein
LGKYYSTAPDSDALAHANGFAIANRDLFSRAERQRNGLAFSDVRISDFESDPAQVNTAAALAKRVLLMQLHAAFMGVKDNEVCRKTLVVLVTHRHRSGVRDRAHVSRALGTGLRQSQAL